MKIPVINHTVNETRVWLQQLAEELGCPEDYKSAFLVFRSVTQALRDTLTPDELMELASGMTPLLRGFLFDGHPASGASAVMTTPDAFLDAVDTRLCRNGVTGMNAATASRAVFRQLEKHLDESQARPVIVKLHAGIKKRRQPVEETTRSGPVFRNVTPGRTSPQSACDRRFSDHLQNAI